MIYKVKPITGDLNEKEARTLIFAARELGRYLGMVTNDDYPVIPTDEFSCQEENTMYLGVALTSLPTVSDTYFDDAISISTNAFGGIITGTNARSVLIAVYRFLKEHGFRFLKPGKKGEYIPTDFEWKNISITEAASYRHRAVCIEGVADQESVFDMVEWMPKVGMNEYFTQFQIPRTFFTRRIEEVGGSITEEEVASLMKLVEDEIQKRSMLYITVGHGWTCNAIGFAENGNGWDHIDISRPKEHADWLALVDGERKFQHNNCPMNTELCYSNPEVKKAMVNSVVEYCIENPHVDYVAFCFSDGRYHCECDNCKVKQPSDHLVDILNDIDAALTERNIKTKIIFPAYGPLLWSPSVSRFKNQERFCLEFAPSSRSFSEPLRRDPSATTMPYELNKPTPPGSNAEMIAYLDKWQKIFKGETVNFDYHFIWGHYKDLTHYALTKVLHQDIQNYSELGLNGLINCAVQKISLSPAIGLTVVSTALWNKNISFDDIVDDEFKYEFGEDADAVKACLDELSKNICYEALQTKRESDINSPECFAKMRKAKKIIKDFMPVIEKNISRNSQLIEDCWEGLKARFGLIDKMMDLYLSETMEELEKAEKEAKEFGKIFEREFKGQLDCHWLFHEYPWLLKPAKTDTMKKEYAESKTNSVSVTEGNDFVM